MSAVNLGSITGSGTANGLVSGLDSKTIIESLKAVRQKPIDDLQTKIDKNTSKITAYSDLTTLINKLKGSINYLRNAQGVSNKFSDVFNYRLSSVSSSTLTASSYLTVNAAPTAQTGNIKVEISSLAEALEQRTSSFNSRNTSATTSATGSYFTAGTFQVGSSIRQSVTGSTLSGFTLSGSDYSRTGSGTGILTSAGIHNFNTTGDGITTLQGSVSSFGATYNSGTGKITATAVINGVTYTSGLVTANASINAGANTGITSGTTITFTNGTTSFDVITSGDIIIDGSQTNANTFATNLKTATSAQSIFQSRKVNNFVDANVKSPLTGLTNDDIRFISNSYGSTGTFGSISNFNVQASTGADGIISVEINGEVFKATNLGTTLNSQVTLQSATSDKQLKIDFTGLSVDLSTSSAASSVERSLEYAFGTRDLIDISIASGDSLNDVVYSINQKTSDTGLSASIIKVSDLDYRVSFKAVSEGIENKYELFDNSGVLTHASLSTTNQAEDAVFRVDGVELTRSSNTVTDAISDVTLKLLQVTPDYDEPTPDSLNISITNDVDSVATTIADFVNAYNDLRVFSAQQNERDTQTQEYVDTAILGGDTVLKSFADRLLNEISSAFSTGNTDFDSLSDAGLVVDNFEGSADTLATSNILKFDETTLKDLITANFDKIRKIFELSISTDSNDIALYKSSNAASLNDFKLDIDLSRDEGEQVKLLDSDGDEITSGGQPVYLDYLNGKITGKTGTVVDGLEFIYTGDGTDVVSVSFVQGLADRVYNLADEFTKSDGVISSEVTSLSDSNTESKTKKSDLELRLEDYVNVLKDRYAALEAAIQSVNSVILLLDAQNAVNTSRN